MKTRTLIELLTLGSNLYILSQDKELMEKLGNMVKEGKEKFDEFLHTEAGDSEDSLLAKLKEKAAEMEAKMAEKLEETSLKVYQKLHIAHVREVDALKTELAELKAEINELKSR